MQIHCACWCAGLEQDYPGVRVCAVCDLECVTVAGAAHHARKNSSSLAALARSSRVFVFVSNVPRFPPLFLRVLKPAAATHVFRSRARARAALSSWSLSSLFSSSSLKRRLSSPFFFFGAGRARVSPESRPQRPHRQYRFAFRFVREVSRFSKSRDLVTKSRVSWKKATSPRRARLSSRDRPKPETRLDPLPHFNTEFLQSSPVVGSRSRQARQGAHGKLGAVPAHARAARVRGARRVFKKPQRPTTRVVALNDRNRCV